jgi:O-antigen ligase
MTAAGVARIARSVRLSVPAGAAALPAAAGRWYREVGCRLWPLLLLLPLAAFAGLTAAFLPWFLLLPFYLVPVFPLAAWWRPEYAIAFLLLVVGGFLPDALLPNIPLFGGTLRAQDIFLLLIAAIALFKHGAHPSRWWPGLAPLAWPLAALMAWAAASAVYSRLGQGTAPQGIIEEFRPYVFWTLPLWLAMVLDSPAARRRFVVALMVAAAVLALAQVLQATTGLPVIHGGRLEGATVGRQEFAEVLRSTVPGIYLILLALLLVVSRHLLGRQDRWSTLALGALFVAALLFTFGRTLWLTAGLGLLLVGLSLGLGKLTRIGLAMGAAALVAFALIALAKPQTAEVMIDRALSISEEDSSNRTSLGWRFEENRLAWNRIRQSPLIGIGLGAAYKPMGYQRGWEGEQRITHNAHVYVLLKLGLVGYGLMAWLWFAYWRRSARLLAAPDLAPSDRAWLVASRSLLPMILVTSFTRPEWMEPATVCAFAAGLGLMAALENHRRPVPAAGPR